MSKVFMCFVLKEFEQKKSRREINTNFLKYFIHGVLSLEEFKRKKISFKGII